ncbi:MAG: hypothetical protein BWY96_02970 [Spirochaetes bacterium ADurb.BinA120]|nr:MAG: hypothetical protein BWY96_02970 [Spirochaetes bacterium ADurb.BinA120]
MTSERHEYIADNLRRGVVVVAAKPLITRVPPVSLEYRTFPVPVPAGQADGLRGCRVRREIRMIPRPLLPARIVPVSPADHIVPVSLESGRVDFSFRVEGETGKIEHGVVEKPLVSRTRALLIEPVRIRARMEKFCARHLAAHHPKAVIQKPKGRNYDRVHPPEIRGPASGHMKAYHQVRPHRVDAGDPSRKHRPVGARIIENPELSVRIGAREDFLFVSRIPAA